MNFESYFSKKIIKNAALKFGTPLYLYNGKFIRDSVDAYKKAFKKTNPLLCYAMKANSNISLCRILSGEKMGADVVSAGELYIALKSGFGPENIVFSGVGKKADEIEYALRSGILMLNVESFDELKTVEKTAGKLKKRAPVSVRINPDINPGTHSFINTGKSNTKFGVSPAQAARMCEYASRSPRLNPVGIHCHLGSQIHSARPYLLMLKKIRRLFDNLSGKGIKLKYADIGGGWGVDEKGFMKNPRALAGAVEKHGKGPDNVSFILEPGRSLVAGAGILVSRVLYRKKNGGKWFIIIDAAMNDFIRPAFYGGEHFIGFLKKGRKKVRADIVGPVCESGDFMAKDLKISLPENGDLLFIAAAGAYGFSMSSRYNSRPRAAEVLIGENGRLSLIRRRETFSELI